MSADMRPEVIDREGFASQSGSPAGNSAAPGRTCAVSTGEGVLR